MTSRRRPTAALVTGVACALAVACLSACSRGPVTTTGPVRVTGTAPPPLTVLARDTSGGNGDIFIAPAGGGYPAGPEIVTTTGKVVWASSIGCLLASSPPTSARRPTWAGRCPRGSSPRASEAGGQVTGPGLTGPSGTDYIYSDKYRLVATVRAGNGAANTFHEFLDHALEHRADRGRHDDDRGPELHRRPHRSAGHRRPCPGDRHP